MLQRILVPLDGSAFGEQALPIAIRIAERDHAELELVHAYESLPPFRTIGAPSIDPAFDQERRKEYADYLDGMAEWVRERTAAPVVVDVIDGPPGPALVDHLAGREADLVVMATHGRSGLSRVWLGSVATDLVRHAATPLLLIRPAESGSRDQPARRFTRVLLPLDGSRAGEEAIEHAMAVAGDAGVEFILVYVIAPALYINEPHTFAYPHEAELQTAAEAYLGDLANSIRERGFAADTRVLLHPQPARAILECASESAVDLIAMETHGRGGVARLLMGSVADKVVRASPVPVLLHRPRVEGAQPVDRQSEKRSATGRR
jgi:nucleotide-binding universal stress UspA family protein